MTIEKGSLCAKEGNSPVYGLLVQKRDVYTYTLSDIKVMWYEVKFRKKRVVSPTKPIKIWMTDSARVLWRKDEKKMWQEVK